jgi:predicted nucleic acid-binding protein
VIVADTSALISLASIDLLETVLAEYDVHTTETVVDELEATSTYEDHHGEAANAVCDNLRQITVHHVEGDVTSSRIDAGEGSCALLTRAVDAEFLLTDDLRALPELQPIADAQVAISPIVLKALVKRDVLDQASAVENLDELAANRDWLGAPIYRRAVSLFE